ncbi:hypothetical protein [Botrimarina hoheduenensis]|uniref:hypothetical protein n=1 Tax=Botrimarina hoheduenensis TaxID=2528000 RepID=UPI001E5EF6EA|nr:hypothetical protein [Botrimarina hoheduenensis]
MLAVSTALAVESQWVTTGATGRLIYTPDAEGDRIMDFSSVGYRGQGVEAIPSDVPTVLTLSPIAGDDTAQIQAALNAVGNLPIGANGYRGAVLLQAGSYDINTQLLINKSGVVLRGTGRDAGGTVLHGRTTGPNGTNQRPLIEIKGSGGLSNSGSQRTLIDKVVPAGATSFRVNTSSGFAVGDSVRVIRGTNAQWISDLGMDMIPPRSDGGTVTQWTPTTINQRFDRVITRIEGDRVFIDAPLPHAIEQHYGGGTIQRYTWSGAIDNVGIENLRGESDFDSATDEDHAWEFISIGDSHTSGRAQNVWVRDIAGKYFGDSLVVANPGSKWVTVANSSNEDPKSIVTGGRRYSYDLSGELGLVTNVTADSGRHDFVNNSTSPKGPNVFHNSIATNAQADSGPHQRYATGTLFDNITVVGDEINARNRGNAGSGHGWSGANMVIWNSTAQGYRVQNPPGAQNWLVGSTGTIVEDTQFGPQPSGYYDSPGQAVTTGGVTSLYDAQMNDARDLRAFRWAGGVGVWSDDLAWTEGAEPGVYEVSARDYLVGDIDGFTPDGSASVDNAYIDPQWQALISGSSGLPLTGFDDTAGNKNVAFTVQHTLDAGERVIHGSLALSLKQSGGVIDSDFLRLFNSQPQNRLSFVDLGWSSQINATTPFVGVVDLGGALGELQQGSINVQVNDDVAVDWAMFVATVATPKADPLGADVTVEAGGILTVDQTPALLRSLRLGGTAMSIMQVASDADLLALEYEQAANGVLALSLGGTAAGAFASLSAGSADLDGVLAVSLEGGFVPQLGDSFAVISAPSLTGQFATLTTPALAAGLAWDASYSPTGLTLSVVTASLPGDYNNDGQVDAADYTVWRDALGSQMNLAADGSGNGIVDQADYNVWVNNFGATFSIAIAVPEPSAGVAMAVLLLMTSRCFSRTLSTR